MHDMRSVAAAGPIPCMPGMFCGNCLVDPGVILAPVQGMEPGCREGDGLRCFDAGCTGCFHAGCTGCPRLCQSILRLHARF